MQIEWAFYSGEGGSLKVCIFQKCGPENVWRSSEVGESLG